MEKKKLYRDINIGNDIKYYTSSLTNIFKKFGFKKIQYKIAFLFLVTILFSIIVFLIGTIPFQKSAALERMKNEARDITNSISQVTTTAIISEDYSFAVDHCLSVLKQSKNIVYIVITKKNGFSLIHYKGRWSIDTLKSSGGSANLNQVISEININQFSENREVFSYSNPFSYSGINWGWIHIGLSLKKFNSDNNSITNRSILLALVCIIIGLFAAFYFTKKLIDPIKVLDNATKELADGDLSVRALIKTGDELQSLGESFNKMTEALNKSRDDLLAVNEFTNNIIKSLNDTLIVCDNDWRITKVNLATTKVLGYSEEELLDESVDVIFDDESAKKFKENFMNQNLSMEKNGFYYDELYYYSKDMQLIPVLFSSSVLQDKNREIAGYVIIALDITERKKSETALQAAHDELEQRVMQRTKELENLNSALVTEINNRIKIEEKIKASLQEKEVLLKEIHHRVKNNLQVISSLLYLQSKKIEITEYKNIFNESQNRIKSMALVHEKLYQSDNLSGIELPDYIKSLINYLMRTYNINYNKIRHEIVIDKILLSIDKAIPFGLIINELVTNALKYAFAGREEGLLKITISKEKQDMIKLIVFDDGVGFPPEYDMQYSTSLGLRLVQSLVSQLEGSYVLNFDHGTEFIIEFSEVAKGRFSADPV